MIAKSRSKKRRKPLISERKAPAQARSRQMVDDILQASIRVLEREGAKRFTTARVAEVAGISVGSLYQYFPNKQALLFRLQQDEWDGTLGLLAATLNRKGMAADARLRLAIRKFFETEAAEAPLRRALDEACAEFRHLPEADAHRARVRKLVNGFLVELLPGLHARRRAFLVDFLSVVMGSVAEGVTGRPEEIRRLRQWANATAEMLASYFERITMAGCG